VLLFSKEFKLADAAVYDCKNSILVDGNLQASINCSISGNSLIVKGFATQIDSINKF